ncbi:hypothetical protein V8E55_008233 [Tylopilus felleus]
MTSSPIPGTSSQTHPHNLVEALLSPPSPSLPAQTLSSSALEVSRAFNSRKISHPPLDIYTPSSDAWSAVYPAPDPEHGCPGARSVHGLVPFTSTTQANTSVSVPVALLYHGERNASSIGHAGAGVFWDDVWLLVVTSTSNPSTSGLQWKKLRVDGNPAPGPREWFPSASYVRDGKTRIVLAEGLLSSNERSGEIWVGEVEL